MRTMLTSKVTLLFMMLGLLLAIPAIALADTLFISNDLTIGGNATKAPGDTGTANVWLEPTNGTPVGDANGCNASTNVGQEVTVTLSSNNASVTFPNGDSVKLTDCGTANAKQLSYEVASNAQAGTAVISGTATGGKDTGTRTYNTNDTLTITITAPPNTAPSKPGKPELASGFNTPNQGIFDLTWTASTDDGKPNPPAAVTYRLEHQDANDAAYSLVSGAGTLSTNSFSFPSGSKEGEGTWTYQVRASDSLLSSAFSDASSTIKVDKSAPSAPVATTNPLSPVFDGWFKDTVTVSYNGSTDPALLDTSAGSGVASYTAAQIFSTSGPHSYSGTATDGAANVSDPVTGSVKVDTNNPTFGPCPTAGPFLVNNGTQSVGTISAFDAGESGVNNANSTLSGTVNTGTLGPQQVTFMAKDNVGHEATTQCSYNVIAHNFIGFSSPVDNAPVLNTVKAGQGIPLKWRLMDASGNPVTNLQSVEVKASGISCALGTSADQVEEVASGSSGLQNLGDGYYQFNWKSPTSYAKSCKSLQINGLGMQLTVQQQPLFQFTR